MEIFIREQEVVECCEPDSAYAAQAALKEDKPRWLEAANFGSKLLKHTKTKNAAQQFSMWKLTRLPTVHTRNARGFFYKEILITITFESRISLGKHANLMRLCYACITPALRSRYVHARLRDIPLIHVNVQQQL
jgi:hypothetical protein